MDLISDIFDPENVILFLLTMSMLQGISPLIIPELLSIMARMGHGDEIIPEDAHFAGETFIALNVQYN